MIKINNTTYSNLFFGTVIFFGFLLMWGCAKNVAPPEVEEPSALVSEGIPEPETQPGIDLTQEKADSIQERGAGFVGSGFETSGPEAIGEADVVEEVAPGQEIISAPGIDLTQEPGFSIEPEVAEQMDTQDPTFIAPGAEPLQEARAIPNFRDEQQLQDIHFEYDRDRLDTSTKTILRANAEWLKKNPNARVEIQGHADERGTNNYNLGLGERRALQTKKYLVSLGIDESRLHTISYGEEKPFCFDSNENCWWKNRRAHFTVAD